MAKTFNPTTFLHTLDHPKKQWVQSLHEQFNGNVDLGIGTGSQAQDASINAGVYNRFEKGNGSGILVRVDANGTNHGAPYTWPGAGGLSIVHGLGRLPIGFHVVDSDKDVRVFRTAAPTAQLLIVKPSDITASVTLYIF